MASNDLYVVGIGASAGGHDALKSFFENLDDDLPAAYVVVTHLLRSHESQLDKIIARFTPMPVHRIKGITQVRRGEVYVLPENAEVKIKDGFLYLYPRRENEGINRAIDIFFESLAIDKKELAVGIIMSGMGYDGSDGAQKLFEYNGMVLVQEPASTKFNSMPWAAIMKDHPDYILPPKQLAGTIGKLIKEKPIKVAS
ncbi:chemotaxis protein CheB [Chryseosolibacter indicus]|uniref:protein-glutamate methylesterase n=1 Tax=Chryseosolibacter indicus TaxID=2782351 RepID=A0ABS5VN70_9BACT|nr:chemotaxis protein CheB [Chryseosolibacter indicus]MBT1702897.1 chemotaxis protein CheB [Chryseosolibacter indicus]